MKASPTYLISFLLQISIFFNVNTDNIKIWAKMLQCKTQESRKGQEDRWTLLRVVCVVCVRARVCLCMYVHIDSIESTAGLTYRLEQLSLNMMKIYQLSVSKSPTCLHLTTHSSLFLQVCKKLYLIFYFNVLHYQKSKTILNLLKSVLSSFTNPW